MNIVRAVRVPLSLAVCILVTGCGGPTRLSTVQASGTVYLDDKPHGPARLTLTPVSAGSTDVRSAIGGDVEPDGKFKLTTYEEGDGAPPGEYTVTLGAAVSDAGSTDPAAMMSMMGGGGVSAAPLSIAIPGEGSENLELKFTSVKSTGPSDPKAPIGAAPTP